MYCLALNITFTIFLLSRWRFYIKVCDSFILLSIILIYDCGISAMEYFLLALSFDCAVDFFVNIRPSMALFFALLNFF